jgi:UDP-2-acetamido-3-amino-2,3-dideoxy-glucuronate N-acetyltransferase
MSARSEIFVHPTALCESDEVGPGTRIWAYAHVMKGAAIGRDCNIGDHAFVETGARIGDRVTVKNQVMIWNGVEVADDVFIGPGVTFTNDLSPRSPRMRLPAVVSRYQDESGWLVRTWVERGASLGARCVILAGTRIGSFALVGAGAVVTRSVPAHGLVMGIPAKRVGWVCRCGARLQAGSEKNRLCPRCQESGKLDASTACTNPEKSS